MTAIEYFKARNRMTKNCTIGCLKCPLSDENNGENCFCEELEQTHPEKAIEIVETYAKEHPAKTRQSEFLKMFPDSGIDSDGIINLCPLRIYRKYTCSGLIDCDTCHEKFWMEEIV